jgi:hypothetical protein
LFWFLLKGYKIISVALLRPVAAGAGPVAFLRLKNDETCDFIWFFRAMKDILPPEENHYLAREC